MISIANKVRNSLRGKFSVTEKFLSEGDACKKYIEEQCKEMLLRCIANSDFVDIPFELKLVKNEGNKTVDITFELKLGKHDKKHNNDERHYSDESCDEIFKLVKIK